METSNKFSKKIKLIIFDQYGTIVDMQKGLTEAVIPFLKKKNWHGDPNRFVTWWRRTHFENSMIDALSKNNHTNYRIIGQNAVSYVMDRCNIQYTENEVEWLIKQIETLKPFPDVIKSLNKLRTSGYKLAILSNGDADMLNNAKQYIGFDMDYTISVQEAGYFKPHWKTYSLAVLKTKTKKENCLFVANHAFDCIGAKSFGMLTAFVDRRKRPFGHTPFQPDMNVQNFEELSNLLTKF